MSSASHARRRSSLELALAAVSLANILVLRSWAWVLDPATQYFLDAPRPWQGYAGAFLLFASLAAAGIAATILVRRVSGRPRRLLESAFLLAIALALYCSREQIADLTGRPVRSYIEEIDPLEKALGFVSALFALAVLLPLRQRDVFRRGSITALLVLSPFILVTTGQAAFAGWKSATSRSGVDARPSAARFADAGGNRVVIVVLDEWDQFLTFEDRAPGLTLPSIDALVSESVHLTRAIPPATVTELVIPALLTGRTVVDSADAGHSDRLLRFEDGTTERFSDVETILSRVRETGRDAGLAGWYHPYCRILGDDLASCESRAIRPELGEGTLLGATAWHSLRWLEGVPQGRRVRRLLGIPSSLKTSATWHEESWRRIHERALTLVADPGLEVVIAHYPLPHSPWLRRATTHPAGRPAYDGNLQLADECLGELVAEIDRAGLAARTSLIVLSDHAKRGPRLAPLPSERLASGELRPVPMLVRMHGGGGPIAIERPLSTLIVHDLVLDILEGNLEESVDVDAWLDDDTAKL